MSYLFKKKITPVDVAETLGISGEDVLVEESYDEIRITVFNKKVNELDKDKLEQLVGLKAEIIPEKERKEVI